MSSASSTRSQDSGLASPPGEFVDSVTSQEGTNSGSASRRASLTTLEPKRKSNGDAAALHKLEKVIKRDLGTRTSFSKFLMSSGLQNGLFGICKAYALFDEEVGYAQGMNFIVMPLLFNVSNLIIITTVVLTQPRDARRRSLLPLRAVDEPLWATRYVCTRYAWSASSSLPIRAVTRGL